MILLLGHFSLAASPIRVAPPPVDTVACVRPVHFATPHPWSWSAEQVPVTDAYAVLVRADPDLLAIREVGQPVLYVDGWPAEVLRVEGDKALVLAPGQPPVDGVRAWFGPTTLPERVDAVERARAEADAVSILPRRPGRVDAGLSLTEGALRSEWIPTLWGQAASCPARDRGSP